MKKILLIGSLVLFAAIFVSRWIDPPHQSPIQHKAPAIMDRVNTKLETTEQIETDNAATEDVKKKVCVLLEKLLAFKDRSDFKKFGFGKGGPYNAWLVAVESLRDAQPKGFKGAVPLRVRVAPSDLLMLGMEFSQHEGETNYTRTILPELKETIGYDHFLKSRNQK